MDARYAACPPLKGSCPPSIEVATKVREVLADEARKAGRRIDDPRKYPLALDVQCPVSRTLDCAEKSGETAFPAEDLATFGRAAHVLLHDLVRAERLFAAAIRRKPDDLPMRVEHAQLLVDLGRHEAALEALRELEKRATAAGDAKRAIFALEYQGRALGALGRTEEAGATLQRAVKWLDEVEAKERGYWGCPYHALGEHRSRSNDPVGKAAALVRAATIEENDPGTQVEAAIALLGAGDFVRAREFAAKSAETKDPSIAAAAKAVLRSVSEFEALPAGSRTASTLLREAARLVVLFEAHEVGAAERYEAMAAAAGGAAVTVGEKAWSAAAARSAWRAFEQGLPEASAPTACAASTTDVTARGDTCLLAVLQLGRTVPPEVLGTLSPTARALVEGFQLLAKKSHAEASARFTALLAKGADVDGDQARFARLGEAWALQGQSKHVDAIHLFDAILAEVSDHVPALLGKGHSLLALEKGPEAGAVFKAVLAKRPGNPEALSALGLVYYNSGALDEAERAFQAATVAGEYTCPHEGLGLVYLRQGKVESAKREFETAIRIDPDVDFKKYNALARLRLDEGRVAEARQLLEKSLANSPGNEEAVKLLQGLPTAP